MAALVLHSFSPTESWGLMWDVLIGCSEESQGETKGNKPPHFSCPARTLNLLCCHSLDDRLTLLWMQESSKHKLLYISQKKISFEHCMNQKFWYGAPRVQ